MGLTPVVYLRRTDRLRSERREEGVSRQVYPKACLERLAVVYYGLSKEIEVTLDYRR